VIAETVKYWESSDSGRHVCLKRDHRKCVVTSGECAIRTICGRAYCGLDAMLTLREHGTNGFSGPVKDCVPLAQPVLPQILSSPHARGMRGFGTHNANNEFR
jgi:hypothetical protein